MVVLIGPKHSGKSSVGRELASLLNIPFYDLDELIEERTGKSVRALFNEGMELFWQEEAAAIRFLLESAGYKSGTEGALAAAGGGITDNPDAVLLLQNGALLVYLDVSAQTAWRRIAREGELPPFLKAETTEASMEKHQALHERRSNDCRKIAGLCIQADHKTPEELAEEIARCISE